MKQVINPIQFFADSRGLPLDAGYVYIGQPNLNPITNPITVYFDAALTIPAAQPLRTLAGRIVRNGAPSILYTSLESYSMVVKDKNGVTLINIPDASGDSNLATLLAQNTGAGLIGHGFTVNYALGTVGRAINDLCFQVHDTGTAAGNCAAINAAIAFVSAGTNIYLPDAMDLDSTVTINVNKAITIRGNPNKKLRFTSTVGSGVLPINITASGAVIEDCWFSGELIVNTNNPLDTVYYIRSDVSGATIRNNRFTDFPVYRVPAVSLKEDTSLNTNDWFVFEGNYCRNTGGGVLTVTSNSRIVNNSFFESTDTAIAINGMGARHTTGAVIVGNVIVTNAKVGPYLIAIEGSADQTITGNYVHSAYGQALSAIDVDPGTQTAEKLGVISGNVFRCETTADTDPRTLVQIGAFYYDGSITGNAFRGAPGVGTNASQLLVSLGNHLVSGNDFDTGHTPTANAYAVIDYQPASVAGMLNVRGNTITTTRAARAIGSTFTGNFSSGSNLFFSDNALINGGAFCSIMVDAPANGAAVDPNLAECFGNTVIGTAIPTMINGLVFNSQLQHYGRDSVMFSGVGSAGRTVRSPASFTGINYYSDSITAAGTGWRHLSCTSSTGGTENLAILGNGNVQNANNSYGALSDIKLKQDIVDAGSQWGDIKALRLRKYRFKNNPTGPLQIGLIAQEAEITSPGLIDETPDSVVSNGEVTQTGETTKTIKYSVLYMKAVGALQEAMQRIESLEAKIDALTKN
jgi:hypothetical protein